MLVSTPIDAVHKVQRVARIAFPDPAGPPAGFPNSPVWANDDLEPVDFFEATMAMWDGDFTATSARLIRAIGENPSKIPSNVSSLDRDAVLALYADELAALEAAEQEPTPEP